MSAGTSTAGYREVTRPGARTRMLAVLVVIALAALAAYAVYAPPTTVSINAGTRTTPAPTTPAPVPAEPEGNEGGGEGGD